MVKTITRSACWGCLLLAVTLSGCARDRDVHLADNNRQLALAAEQNQVWEGNKGWLLGKLPQAARISQRVTTACKAYPGSKKLRASEYRRGDYDNLFDFMRAELPQYRVQRPPESPGHLILIEGDTAYLYDMIHLEFSGVANLATGLFFVAPDVPLERSDDRSFAFVANGKTDTTTSWYLFRRNILEQDQIGGQDLGSYRLSRAELDSAGVPRQLDFLTPQQREERELAQQGTAWRYRAETRVAQFCSKQEARDGSKKSGGHGRRGGLGNRPAASGTGETPAEASSGSDSTVTESQKGQARLNCRTGSGYILIDSGITAEVSNLLRNREGELSPLISSTSKEMTGATMTYSYPGDTAQGSSIWDGRAGEITLEFKSSDGGNQLNLNLSPDKGITGASLVLQGDWHTLLRKEVSRSELGDLFIRAYRDCAIKNRQDTCKSVPELFVSMLNAGMAQDLVSYISEHYIEPAHAAKKNNPLQ
jgi:hypothetical protein